MPNYDPGKYEEAIITDYETGHIQVLESMRVKFPEEELSICDEIPF